MIVFCVSSMYFFAQKFRYWKTIQTGIKSCNLAIIQFDPNVLESGAVSTFSCNTKDGSALSVVKILFQTGTGID